MSKPGPHNLTPSQRVVFGNLAQLITVTLGPEPGIPEHLLEAVDPKSLEIYAIATNLCVHFIRELGEAYHLEPGKLWSLLLVEGQR